jgi:hypothetical protein
MRLRRLCSSRSAHRLEYVRVTAWQALMRTRRMTERRIQAPRWIRRVRSLAGACRSLSAGSFADTRNQREPGGVVEGARPGDRS